MAFAQFLRAMGVAPSPRGVIEPQDMAAAIDTIAEDALRHLSADDQAFHNAEGSPESGPDQPAEQENHEEGGGRDHRSLQRRQGHNRLGVEGQPHDSRGRD